MPPAQTSSHSASSVAAQHDDPQDDQAGSPDQLPGPVVVTADPPLELLSEVAGDVRRPCGGRGGRHHDADHHHPQPEHDQVGREAGDHVAHRPGQRGVADAGGGGPRRDPRDERDGETRGGGAHADPPARRGDGPGRRRTAPAKSATVSTAGGFVGPPDALADPPEVQPIEHRRGIDQQRAGLALQRVGQTGAGDGRGAGEHLERLAHLQRRPARHGGTPRCGAPPRPRSGRSDRNAGVPTTSSTMGSRSERYDTRTEEPLLVSWSATSSATPFARWRRRAPSPPRRELRGCRRRCGRSSPRPGRRPGRASRARPGPRCRRERARRWRWCRAHAGPPAARPATSAASGWRRRAGPTSPFK